MIAIQWLTTALQEAAGDNLVSLTHVAAGKSKANDDAKVLATLTLVLKDTGGESLAALREPLREGQRRTRITPFVLNTQDVASMLDTLPLRVLMTRLHGTPLLGANPFAAMTIDPEHLRIGLEQETRNLLLRLRHDVVLAPASSHLLLAGLWRTRRGVERILEGLAFLKHGESGIPQDPWADAAAQWSLPVDGLEALRAFGVSEPTKDLRDVAVAVLPLMEALVRTTDQLGA